MHTEISYPLEHLAPPQLVERLGSREFARSQAAAERLFQQGALALDALVAGLSHADWRVRKQCAALMDHLGDDRCLEPLSRALRDPIVGVRRLALHALGCQPCKAAPLRADVTRLIIDRALTDPSLRVRRVAVHLLGLQPHDLRAVGALETILAQETDPPLLSRARHALAEQQKAGDCRSLTCPSSR